ncbi:MAG: SsrA-binding protein SmpB [Myxococcota bacterium]
MAKKQQKGAADGIKIIARNRKALHDYKIADRIEAGIALLGTEVKSLREGKCQLADSYAAIRGGEVFLINCHISHYKNAGKYGQHEPTRKRKLLLKRGEINRLERRVEQKGATLIPLSVYFKKGIAKVELAVCEGKRQYDKREAIKQRDLQREERTREK